MTCQCEETEGPPLRVGKEMVSYSYENTSTTFCVVNALTFVGSKAMPSVLPSTQLRESRVLEVNDGKKRTSSRTSRTQILQLASSSMLLKGSLSFIFVFFNNFLLFLIFDFFLKKKKSMQVS